VSLVCGQLARGSITAIDRSATAIRRAAERNAGHISSGKAVLRQVDLAALTLPGQRFNKIFAVNVNLFWARPADAEWLAVKDHLHHGGVLHLFYDTPGQKKADQVAKAVTAALKKHGLSAMARHSSSPSCSASADGSSPEHEPCPAKWHRESPAHRHNTRTAPTRTEAAHPPRTSRSERRHPMSWILAAAPNGGSVSVIPDVPHHSA
jgi:hypothetical protein